MDNNKIGSSFELVYDSIFGSQLYGSSNYIVADKDNRDEMIVLAVSGLRDIVFTDLRDFMGISVRNMDTEYKKAFLNNFIIGEGYQYDIKRGCYPVAELDSDFISDINDVNAEIRYVFISNGAVIGWSVGYRDGRQSGMKFTNYIYQREVNRQKNILHGVLNDIYDVLDTIVILGGHLSEIERKQFEELKAKYAKPYTASFTGENI